MGEKKTTKEKYNELKSLYNDLLEKHQALAAVKNEIPGSFGSVLPPKMN